MPGQTKYFISNTNGFFVNWYSDITGVESHGQALKASGNSGDDAVYVGQGTKVDATGLTSTGGNDSIYLTGTFNNYEQTLDGNTYTFKRTVTIGGTDYQEEVSFTASNGDRVYFANGFFKIDITGNDGLLNAGVFQKIKSTDIDSSSITPTDPLTTQPAIDKGTASEVGTTKVFISDNNGEHITPGVKGSVFKISGNSGNDTVYVAKGTKVDATGLTSTGGNDVVYLTGTFNEYTKQTVVDSTYTFERTVNIGGTDYQEEVSFTASNGDRVYFANGFVKIDITGDDGLLEAGVFKRIISTDIDGSESTPGLGIGLSITDDLAETSIINKAKVGTDITYTFTFKDDVTGFDKNDIEVTGGTKGAFSGSGSVYSLVVSVTDNSTTDLFVGVAKDAAIGGGIGTKYASNSHKVDTVVPSKPISLDLATEDDSGTSNSDNLTNKTSNLTITGSAEVGATIRLYNGTNTTAIGSEIVKANGTFSIDISLTQSTTPHSITARATDAAGNESLVSDALAITVDTTTATLTAQAMSVILGEDSNLVIDFSENIKAGTGNIVIHKASDNTIVETIAIDNSKISIANDKLTINPTADLTEGTYYIKMASGVITDMAGNVFAGITNLGADTTWAFETKALFTTVMVEGLNDGYINNSEKSTVEISGVITSGGNNPTINKVEFFKDGSSDAIKTINNVSVDNNKIWKIENNELVALNLDDGSYTLKITLADGGTSVTSIFPTSGSIIIDTLAPTALNVTATLISNTDSDITVTSTDSSAGYLVHNSLTGDAINTVVKLEALVTSNKVNVVRGLGDNSAHNFNPNGLIEGTYNWYLADQAGNISAESNDVVMDNTAPILTTQASAELGETSDLILDFNEDIQAGSTGSIVIKGSDDGVIATINITETTKFSITGDKLTIDVSALGLTDNKLTQGSYYITMDAGTVTDIAGNDAAAITKDTNQWVFATKALFTTIAWIGADDNYINNTEKGTDLLSGVVISTTTTPTIEEIRFYEVTNGVTSSTAVFTIAKSNITQPATVSGVAKSWSITAANMPDLADGKTYIAKIDLKDGSTEVTKTSKAVTYDFTAPTVSSVVFTSNPGADKTYKAGDTVEITVTISENTTVTDSPRIALLSGKYATYASGSGSDKLIFTYTVATGDTDANGLAIVANALNLNGGTLTDTAGNTAVITHAAVADNAEHMVDTTLPTLIISNNITGDAGINANITYTFSFGEAVINFDETDISVSNGKKGLFTKVSDTRYTLIVTQTGSANDITVSVATGAAKDSAGNLSISAQSVQTTDLERPTIAISMDNTNSLRNGETATVTFDFSEELATDSFNLNDITTANGNLTNLSIDSTNLSRYTATYTATKDIDSIHISFSITTGWTDTAGNTPAAPIQVSVTSEHQSSPILAVKQGEDQYLNAAESTINIEIALQPDAKKDDKIQLKTSSKTLGNPYIITQADIGNGKCLIEVNKAILGGDGTEVGIIAFMQYQSGNVSKDSNVLLITIDETPPLPIANSWHINTPPMGQNAFKSGNLIELSLTTNEPLKFGNTAGSQLMMDDKVFTLDTFKSSATSNKQLVFTHQVQANETMARQQAVISADKITLNGVTDLAGNTLDLSTLAETSLYSSAIFYQPSTHPFDSINTTNNATPTFADIDQDGDLDLIIGNATGTLSYYQNKNNSGTNSFTKITLNNPFQNIQHINATPTFADIDQDGDLDLIVGAGDGKLYFYKNTQQSFNLVASNFNPFSHISIGANATPTFADINQDGYLDLIIGNTTGKLTYYQNTKNTFTKVSATNNPFQNITHANASPTFVDIDQDGDLDLVIGDSNGKLHYYYRNTNGVFTVQTGSNNPIANIAVSNNAKPTFADIDSNGTLDLIIGDQNGLQYYQRQHSEVIDTIAPRVTLLIKNTTLLKGESTQVIFNFSEAVKDFSRSNLSADNATLSQLELNPNRHSTQPFSYIATLTPTDDIKQTDNCITVNTNWHDLNGNTPADSLTSNNYEILTDTSRIKPQNWESNKPPSGQEAFAQGDTITITLTLTGNIKVDNKVDNEQAYLIISGKRFEVDKAAFDGATDKTVLTFTYTVKAGDTLGLSDFVVDKEQVFLTGVTDASDNAIDIATMPDQVQLLGGQSLFKQEDSLSVTVPSGKYPSYNQFYVDINADGYMDVISTHNYAVILDNFYFYFFQGSADGLQFKEVAGTLFDNTSLSGDYLSSVIFADVDGDNDLDMLVGQSTGNLRYFENANGVYSLNDGHSLSHISHFGITTPTFADIDADGDADVIVGDSGGGLRYFTNHQGVFTQQTGTNNPFTMDVGTNSKPAFADVDADGDLDLLIGNGSIWYYYENINNIWRLQTNENNPFNGFADGTPNFVDVDFDGKMDLVVTTGRKTYYYHNIQRPIIDTTPPEAPLIKIHDTSLATGDTTLVEFHFKEKVLDFTTDDITAENASLSEFRQNTGLGPFVWTAILTPDTGITDSINTLTVGTDWHDVAGNKPSQPSTSANYKVINQEPPKISTTTTDWVFNTPPAGQKYFSIGDTMTLTLTVSEAVQVADTSAYITVANKRFNINKSAFDTSTDKTKLSFDYTVVKGDHLIIGDFIVNNTHLTGVTNAAGVAINNLTTELALLKNSDAFERKSGAENPLKFINGYLASIYTSVHFIDLDNDGIQEIAYSAWKSVGENDYSQVFYYKRTDGQSAFTEIPSSNSPFKNLERQKVMTFADMDKDGDLDLLTNSGYYKNNNGTFVKIEVNNSPFATVNFGSNTMHTLVDLDNDGDIDLITSNSDGGVLSYYENNNNTYTIKLTHPLTGLDLGSIVKLTFKDLDGDGDLDLISGSDYDANNEQAINYYKNTGTATTPLFSKQAGANDFFDNIEHNRIQIGTPEFGDINNDGILDFFSATGRNVNEGTNLLYYAQGTTPIIKVKTIHHQDMDAIITYTASDKLAEHFNWNGLTPDNKYSSLKDATITNFDLFNDTLNISYALKHLDENAKLGAITLSKSGQDSTLSIGSFDITLTAVDINTTNLSHLVDTGTILI
uniref:Ig-like domain-containing protein n=1 Tax=Candidatus Thiodubiliella endoseptemdiera TaxID=2738886 RepID=UPI0034DE10C4